MIVLFSFFFPPPAVHDLSFFHQSCGRCLLPFFPSNYRNSKWELIFPPLFAICETLSPHEEERIFPSFLAQAWPVSELHSLLFFSCSSEIFPYLAPSASRSFLSRRTRSPCKFFLSRTGATAVHLKRVFSLFPLTPSSLPQIFMGGAFFFFFRVPWARFLPPPHYFPISSPLVFFRQDG